jgi:hypothetical protein
MPYRHISNDLESRALYLQEHSELNFDPVVALGVSGASIRRWVTTSTNTAASINHGSTTLEIAPCGLLLIVKGPTVATTLSLGLEGAPPARACTTQGFQPVYLNKYRYFKGSNLS